MSDHKDKDQLLSHDADGIREFDNALPRWWLYGFYFTIAFAVVYVVNFHLLETPVIGYRGQAAEYQAEMTAAAARHDTRHGVAPAAATLAALTDADSLAKGEAIFNGMKSLCHTCHRKDLGGLIGPNLTDTRWLHGCGVGDITRNIATGFPAKGMLPFGSGQPLTDEEVLQVASYVLSKRGSNPANPKAAEPERDKDCQ